MNYIRSSSMKFHHLHKAAFQCFFLVFLSILHSIHSNFFYRLFSSEFFVLYTHTYTVYKSFIPVSPFPVLVRWKKTQKKNEKENHSFQYTFFIIISIAIVGSDSVCINKLHTHYRQLQTSIKLCTIHSRNSVHI